MIPVVAYPKKYLEDLCDEIDKTNERIASGEQPVFNSIDALFAKLENHHDILDQY